ncbi:MAG TPA: hypothetical protein VJV79_02000 [Polyangiaceae bacterium]|nr:hypothetical protein [Polyangiaceae bacterium]
MYKQALSAWLLVCGSSLALSSASCGTCPDGQQSCGTANNGANIAGASSSEAPCELWTAFRTCMTSYCKTASNPFCTCYKRGFDISPASCGCIDFEPAKLCAQAAANGVDAKSYSCATDSSRVSTICVSVGR